MASSLKQVARSAGVSAQTVSLVLRGSTKITDGTRSRVLDACNKCGYLPHADARSIRRGRCKRIACVLSRLSGRDQYSPNYTVYLDTIVNELTANEYLTVLEPFYFDDNTYEFIEPPKLFQEVAVDGIVGVDVSGVVPTHVDHRLAQIGTPVVWVNRTPTARVPCVTCDEAAGARALVRHLYALGHRRIGYVGLGFHHMHFSYRDRYEATRSELAALGLDTSAVLVAQESWSKASREICARILDHQPRVTAIIAYNLRVYDSLMQQIPERGLRVPDDVSICSFMSPWERHFSVPITAWEVPEVEMAQAGVRMLIDILNKRQVSLETPEIVGRLALGNSCKPPET